MTVFLTRRKNKDRKEGEREGDGRREIERYIPLNNSGVRATDPMQLKIHV